MDEMTKMKSGQWYDANFDENLLAARIHAKSLAFDYNQTRPNNIESKKEILKQLIPHCGFGVEILAPVQVDYGTNIYIGDHTFVNHNAYFMDGAKISIGNNCFIGPNCGFYTAEHPLDVKKRNQGLERALPIVVEDNVWMGANVTLMPGVRVKAGSIIGANSLVLHDVEASTIVAGVPARFIRCVGDEI